MRILSPIGRNAACIILLALLPSCALWRGAPGGSGVEVAVEAPPERSEAEYRALLDDTVRDEIAAASGRAKAKFVSRKPYFYKTYAEYPDGPGSYTVDMRDSYSRTAPMSADVTIGKYRYSTRFSRNRELARQDENYLRDTGEETVSLEFRNGKWRRLGSLFVADRTEELDNGEWVRVRKDTPAVPGDTTEKAGRFNRLKFWR